MKPGTYRHIDKLSYKAIIFEKDGKLYYRWSDRPDTPINHNLNPHVNLVVSEWILENPVPTESDIED